MNFRGVFFRVTNAINEILYFFSPKIIHASFYACWQMLSRPPRKEKKERRKNVSLMGFCCLFGTVFVFFLLIELNRWWYPSMCSANIMSDRLVFRCYILHNLEFVVKSIE